jgi:2-succinyl-6-hydroxy-2,4-cyclohexadiene-1-carboxylate synthase
LNNPLSIIALHGFTGGGADFSGFAHTAQLSANWSCPDMPGHGANSGLSSHPQQVLEFIEGQLLALASTEYLPSKTLLGYSMGGRAALLHACTFPEKWDALVLISANAGIEDESERKARRDADEALAAQIAQGGVASFIQHWQERPLIVSQKKIQPDWYAAMQHTREQHQAEGLAANLKQFGQGSCPNLWPKLNALTMPVLLISGSEDHKYNSIASRMKKSIPNSRHACIAGAGHMPHLEQAEATAEVLRYFMRDL